MEGCTHSHSGYCSECKLNLEPNCSLEEHQRSRSHINRLLQLGIEIPISSVSHAEETQLPEELKVAYCITCEVSIGNAIQAAAHYRSREHFNRRLQRGLPVTELLSAEQDESPANRQYINECLRRGIGLQQPNVAQPVQSPVSRMPLAVEASRGISGKRKLPTSSAAVYNVAAGSVPANAVPQFTNFAVQKRHCRPVAPLQKQETNYAVKSFAGQGMSYTNQVLPSSSTYSATSPLGNTYQMQAPRKPPTSPYSSQQLASQVEYSWNSFNGNYKDAKLGVALAESWYCDMCNVELPNEGAWQLHMSGAHDYSLTMLGSYMAH